MTDSAILKELICLAFDEDPAPCEVRLADAMDFYARTLAAENGKHKEVMTKVITNFEQKPKTGGEFDKKINTEVNTNVSPVQDKSTVEGSEAVPPEKLVAKGPGAAKKQEIYGRLRAFRDATGPECYAKIAKVSNGLLTEKEVMKMCTGTVMPLPKWTVVDAAIDYLEKAGIAT